MAGTAKATVFRDELASELAIRLSSPTLAKSFGTNGEAQLSVGSLASDSDSILVQFTGVASIQKDVLGLAQNVFTPHIAQLVIEASSTGATWKTRLGVMAACVAKGVRVELYERTHGTGPVFADITAGNLKTTFEIAAQYPLMASM